MRLPLGNLGVHVLKNPTGTFSLVGSIPRELCEERDPTRADIMAGRVDMATRKVYAPRIYLTAEEAFAAIDAAGVGCVIPTCACAGLRHD